LLKKISGTLIHFQNLKHEGLKHEVKCKNYQGAEKQAKNKICEKTSAKKQ